MTIETGISFDDLERESKPPLIPDATYEFLVKMIDDTKTTREGRPRWMWVLQIINNPTLQNRSVIYNTPMPWKKPDGTFDASGGGFLVDILNGIGKKFDGVMPPYPPKELYYGSMGVMKVGHKDRPKVDPNDPDEVPIVDNTVKIITKRVGGGIVS